MCGCGICVSCRAAASVPTTTRLIPGKRYRITAEVTAHNSGIDLDGRTLPHRHLEGMTVELLPDPLPTTPGSVVRINSQVFMRRYSQFGQPWVGEDSSLYYDSELEGAVVLYVAEPRFDYCDRGPCCLERGHEGGCK